MSVEGLLQRANSCLSTHLLHSLCRHKALFNSYAAFFFFILWSSIVFLPHLQLFPFELKRLNHFSLLFMGQLLDPLIILIVLLSLSYLLNFCGCLKSLSSPFRQLLAFLVLGQNRRSVQLHYTVKTPDCEHHWETLLEELEQSNCFIPKQTPVIPITWINGCLE